MMMIINKIEVKYSSMYVDIYISLHIYYYIED